MSEESRPAYLVACGTLLGPEPDPEYEKRAKGPASKANPKSIAGGQVGNGLEVFEGELPEGAQFMAIEQFDSMDALRTMWYSEEFQSALPFRKDAIKMHFVAAMNASPPDDGSEGS